MQGASKYFTDIDDPRSARNQKHPLNMLIGTTLLASHFGNADGKANVHERGGQFFVKPS